MTKGFRKIHKYAFIACKKCIDQHENLSNKAQLRTLDPEWEDSALMYLNDKLGRCPFVGSPPFQIPIRKKYGAICFSCGEKVGCPANIKRNSSGTFCPGCFDSERYETEEAENFAMQYDAECEKHGMDYPEWQIEQQQIRMERWDNYEMEQAKKLKIEIKQVQILTNEKNIVEALEDVVENLKESEEND